MSRPGDLGEFYAIADDVQRLNARVNAELDRMPKPAEPEAPKFFHFDKAPTRGGKHRVTFSLLHPFWATIDGDPIEIEPPTEDRVVKYTARRDGGRTYFEAQRADGSLCPDLDVDLRKYLRDRDEREIAAIRDVVGHVMNEPMYPQLYCAAVAAGAADPLHAAVVATRVWLSRNRPEIIDGVAKKIWNADETN